MAGKSPSALSGREYAILKVLWDGGPLTVREVRDRLGEEASGSGEEEVPYTTVLSLLQLMEKKGYVAHEAEGKTYRYKAKVGRGRTTRLVIRDFVGRFFDGSAEALLMNLAESAEVPPEVWEKLRAETRERQDTADE